MQQQTQSTRISYLRFGIIGGLLFFSLIYRLEMVPPPWWDEGWSLAVARNWVETGHYGQITNGVPRSAGLAGSFPIIAPLALSFRIFGVGLLQARMVGVLFTLGALALLYFLVNRLFDARTATVTLFLLIFTPIADELHPILIGRQVLGEMPAMFYILLGFTFLYFALKKTFWFTAPALLALGIAYVSKAQAPPFLLFSLVMPLSIAVLKRWRRTASILAVTLLGAWLVSTSLPLLQTLIFGDGLVREEPTPGLYSVTALVWDPAVRHTALGHVLAFGLPVCLGLIFAVWKTGWHLRAGNAESPEGVMRIALIGLSGSWLAWYAFSGMFWIRYLFPPFLFGSIFTASLLLNLTEGLNLRSVLGNLTCAPLARNPDRASFSDFSRALGGMVLLIWLAIAAGATLLMLYVVFRYPPVGDAAADTARFLDTQIEAGSLVETYDSEIIFHSHQRFHFPPDVVHVQLIQREFLKESTTITYDPLGANPDYLVVGPFSRRYRLYEDVLRAGLFEPVMMFPEYEIYRRAGDR